MEVGLCHQRAKTSPIAEGGGQVTLSACIPIAKPLPVYSRLTFREVPVS